MRVVDFLLAAIVCVPVVGASCQTPAPPPAPAVDASTPCADPCICACAQLVVAECRWGAIATCPDTLRSAEAEGLKRLDGGSRFTCQAVVDRVHTANDARALGIVCRP